MPKRVRMLLGSCAVAVVMSLAACGSEGKPENGASATGGANAKFECKTEDADGNKYDRCKLAEAELIYVEGVVQRSFEVEGFGLLKVGQTAWLVCHTASSGNSSFGVVIPAGKTRTNGDWTLSRTGGQHAYVGQLIEVAIADHDAKAEELREKLQARYGESIRRNSCEDRKVIIPHSEKVALSSMS